VTSTGERQNGAVGAGNGSRRNGAAVLSLRDEDKITAEVIRRVERDIDLEELRFSS